MYEVPEESPWFEAPQQVEYHGNYDPAYDPDQYSQWYAEQQQAEQYQDQYQEEPPVTEPSPEETGSFPIPVAPGRTRELGEGGGTLPAEPDEDAFYQVFRESIKSGNGAPTPRGFMADVEATYGVSLPEAEAKRMVNRFSNRLNAELADEHIA
ncbi:hypothetical protein [Streptomyces sp. NPDC003832]